MGLLGTALTRYADENTYREALRQALADGPKYADELENAAKRRCYFIGVAFSDFHYISLKHELETSGVLCKHAESGLYYKQYGYEI